MYSDENMNKKLVINYLIYTFLIMICSWGLLDLICILGNVPIDSNILLRIPYAIGGFSPTIASYLALKKDNKLRI